MSIIICRSKQGDLNYISISGLKKSKDSEKIGMKIANILSEGEKISNYTLNNWKGDVLMIRYATNDYELSILFDAIKSDMKLPKAHEERSLLH